MSIVASIIAGALVLWTVAFGPVHLGLLPRRTAGSVRHSRGELAAVFAGSLALATICTLVQRTHGTATLGEAVAVGILLGIVPAAVMAGRNVQSGSIGYALPRIALFLSALTLSSVAMILVRR